LHQLNTSKRDLVAAAPHLKPRARAYHAARVFTTTMGAFQDRLSEGLRRALGLEDRVHARTNMDLVGKYHPTPFGFG